MKSDKSTDKNPETLNTEVSGFCCYVENMQAVLFSLFVLWVKAYTTVDVSTWVGTEIIIVTGQDGVENDASQRCNSKGGQCNRCSEYSKGYAV